MTQAMLSLGPVAARDFDELVAIRIEALRENFERLGRFDPVQSAANRFYLRHGFIQIDESEFDLDYQWYQARGVLV
ncbi:hypothetical protein [Polaromonas sp.]|uniref:hypothetical protein n=1 Tax=Polaromonas sp. TaxID=1869339 RepID=UPI002FCC650C